MSYRKTAISLALLAMLAALAGVAQAGTIVVVHYAGRTSQVYKGKPSPSVVVDVDKTNRAVHYFGIAYKCQNTGEAWTTRGYPSVARGKINGKGNFMYRVSRGKSHLSWISGHIASGKITGSFAATQLGCNAQGTYTATLGGR